MYLYSILNIGLQSADSDTDPACTHVCAHMQHSLPSDGSLGSSTKQPERLLGAPSQMTSQETLTSACSPAQGPGQSSEANSQSRREERGQAYKRHRVPCLGLAPAQRE